MLFVYIDIDDVPAAADVVVMVVKAENATTIISIISIDGHYKQETHHKSSLFVNFSCCSHQRVCQCDC